MRCKYDFIANIFDNGDEDRYCTNDICDYCTCSIDDEICKGCKYYETR